VKSRVFSKNCDRLLDSELAQRCFAEAIKQAKRFMNDEYFTADGTLISTWTSQESFGRQDGDDNEDGGKFYGKKRSNKPHAYTADSGCAVVQEGLRQGVGVELLGQGLVENSNVLIAPQW
jgi:hypothetical protein